MQHAGVLDVGAIANANEVHIAAHHRVEPDAGMIPDDDIADHLRAVFDEDASSDLRKFSLIAAKHSLRPSMFAASVHGLLPPNDQPAEAGFDRESPE
jgi:hypothetical protein